MIRLRDWHADAITGMLAAMNETPKILRLAFRAGRTGTTAGLASGYEQANIAILPARHAADFEAFCRANQSACPLLAVGAPGDPALPTLGEGIDIRTDVPGYRIVENGAAREQTDITGLWRDDLVTFAIGCSYTFEHALMAAGIPLRHVEQRRKVSMYRTTVANTACGPFAGNMVVSMRPMKRQDVPVAETISARFATMHGAPVHAGDPAALGIADIAHPDFGDAVDVLADEVPVFWACGVTSQVAIESAGLPLVIGHLPGCMLITDMRSAA
jgi:uncharacterized protein YcsI (UPF0317 family)